MVVVIKSGKKRDFAYFLNITKWFVISYPLQNIYVLPYIIISTTYIEKYIQL